MWVIFLLVSHRKLQNTNNSERQQFLACVVGLSCFCIAVFEPQCVLEIDLKFRKCHETAWKQEAGWLRSIFSAAGRTNFAFFTRVFKDARLNTFGGSVTTREPCVFVAENPRCRAFPVHLPLAEPRTDPWLSWLTWNALFFWQAGCTCKGQYFHFLFPSEPLHLPGDFKRGERLHSVSYSQFIYESMVLGVWFLGVPLLSTTLGSTLKNQFFGVPGSSVVCSEVTLLRGAPKHQRPRTEQRLRLRNRSSPSSLLNHKAWAHSMLFWCRQYSIPLWEMLRVFCVHSQLNNRFFCLSLRVETCFWMTGRGHCSVFFAFDSFLHKEKFHSCVLLPKEIWSLRKSESEAFRSVNLQFWDYLCLCLRRVVRSLQSRLTTTHFIARHPRENRQLDSWLPASLCQNQVYIVALFQWLESKWGATSFLGVMGELQHENLPLRHRNRMGCGGGGPQSLDTRTKLQKKVCFPIVACLSNKSSRTAPQWKTTQIVVQGLHAGRENEENCLL